MADVLLIFEESATVNTLNIVHYVRIVHNKQYTNILSTKSTLCSITYIDVTAG